MTTHTPYVSRLDAETRKTSIDLLNKALTDAITLGLAIKQAHWTLKGPSFIGLHELMDEVGHRMGDAADMLAERCIILGGHTHGTLEQVADGSSVEPYPGDITWQGKHVEALMDRLMAFGALMRDSMEKASEAGDEDTADLFTEISRTVDKDAWFVGAHAERK
ncbi:DNA starvation/stationary phase protection protein Dps [uncultured Algimonas sp.]|uniref:DNA starvation/stationary phase protection protein Dps n=1 Tax=uncultured Algimonas sp. TaxID=1547920 RepID=UPI002606F6E8|nr:DNA starvation/stationary phase protection protein Dps [uncultured Algimonas sp.]